jgi:hypothetical protein
MFPGDYFEERWDHLAGREYGHYVRVHTGPTPVPTADAVAGYLAQLRAITGRIGRPDAAAPPAGDAGGPMTSWATSIPATPGEPRSRVPSPAPRRTLRSARRLARGFALEFRTPDVIGYRCVRCRHTFGREPSAPAPTTCPHRECPTHRRGRAGALQGDPA